MRKIRQVLQLKKIVYALILSMTFSAPLTAYASEGEQVSFYEKVKTLIFGEEEVIDKDVALTEFRRQFNAGNNNMSQVLGNISNNIASYSTDNAVVDISGIDELEEEVWKCDTSELEEILYGPYDVSAISETVNPEYGFGDGQINETQLRVTVKLTSDASSAKSVVGGTLVAQGEHCNIWVLNPDEYYSVTAREYTMTADNLHTEGNAVGTDAVTVTMAQKIDVIYKKVSTIGEHAGVLIKRDSTSFPAVGDIDMDGRINFILYAIGSGAGGFFNSGDYNPSYTGRAIDAVHITTSFAVDNLTGELSAYGYGSVAHEMQHLLFNMYYGNMFSSELWVNEGLSQISETYHQDYTNSSVTDVQNTDDIRSRIRTALANSYTTGTTYSDFFSWGSSTKNYGISFMFSALLEERDGGYIYKVYDYFKSHLAESTESGYTYDSTLTAANYPGTLYKNWGDMLRVVLGDSVDTSELSSDEVLEYVYIMFMESYMSAGGQVIEDDIITTTDQIWSNGGSLWSFRNGNSYYYQYESFPGIYLYTSTYGNSAYAKILSGGDVTLVGYPNNSTSVEATHEMAYTLDVTDYDVDDTNVLRISIPETEGLRAYVALYDAYNANPLYNVSTTTMNPNYDASLDTADLYPLELGVDNYVTVDSDSIVPHLFVFTYYNDVETTVTYDWIDTRDDLEDVAIVELLEDSFDFDNTAKTPTVTVKRIETNVVLTEGQDYTVSYSDNINAGEATVTIEGMGSYKGSLSENFEILPISIVNATIIGINTRYSYTGSAITPSFSVTMNGSTLEANKDYTYTFTDNVAITKKGYLTIEGINNYKESVGAYFEIYN